MNDHESYSLLLIFLNLDDILIIHGICSLKIISISEGVNEHVDNFSSSSLVSEYLNKIVFLFKQVFGGDLVDDHFELFFLHF